MPTATWNGKVIARSETFEDFDGNVYFPPGSLVAEHFEPSDTRTTCGWKGEATYQTLVVDGQRNPDAVWCYEDPKPEAASIRGHFAFWKGVEVQR